MVLLNTSPCRVARLFTKAQFKEILDRDGPQCHVCLRIFSIDMLEADHVIPFSRGGKTEVANGAIICKRDNRRKGNKVGYEAMSRREQRGLGLSGHSPAIKRTGPKRLLQSQYFRKPKRGMA